MIKLNGVTKTYVVKNRRKTALNNISLNFPSKGFYSIIGKSGSGKSTLLNILGCLDKPTTGNMYIDDIEINQLSSRELDYYRNTMIGFVFQNFNLIDEYTVYDNISLALELQNCDELSMDSKITTVLNKLDISSIDYKYPNQISGGEKQRVAIARALIKEPKILLVDEPTGNLDKENANKVMNILKNISEKMLVIMVTHDEKIVKKYSDGVVKINNGIIESNTIECNDSENNEKIEILKKSKLGNKRIFKFATSNIKNRKLKFVNMILLLTITFSFLFSSLHFFKYDKGSSAYNNFKNNGIETINLIKSKEYCEGKGISKVCWTETSSATKNDIEILKNKYNNIEFNYLKAVNLYISNEDDYDSTNPYYDNTIKGIVYVKNMSNISHKLKYGTLPVDNGEILVSEYLAEMITKFVYKDIKSYDQIINNYLPINNLGSNLKIVGVVEDSHKEYEKLKNYERNGYFNQLLNNFQVHKSNDYSLIYVKDSFEFSSILNSFTSNEMKLKYNYTSQNFNILSLSWSAANMPFLGNSRNIENDNEIILDIQTFSEIFKISKQSIYDNNSIVDDYLNTNIWLEYSYDALNKKSKSIVYKVVGVVEHESGVYVSNNDFDILYEDIIVSNSWMYSGVYMELQNDNKNQSIQLLNDLENLGYRHNTSYSEALYVSDNIFDSLKTIFIVIIVTLIIFSCLLILSTIKSTIVDRLHDIGILKSLGATNFDICKIFLLESGMVTIIVSVLSISIGILTNSLINKIISNSFNVTITVLYFNVGAMIEIIALLVVLTNLFCLLALKDIFSTRPIETINK